MSDADEDELLLPVPATSHRFKRFGTVQFSDPAYTQSPLLSSLPTAGSLLAVSNRYGLLFLLSSSSPPSLLVASTSAVLRSVEADRRQQAEEAEHDGGSEGNKRTTDAAASPNVFIPVAIADSDRLRHLSLSSEEDWLAAVTDDTARLYHISQFVRPTAGAVIQPLHSVELLDAVDALWWPYERSLLIALSRKGHVSGHYVTAQGMIENWRYSSTSSAITAICYSKLRHKLWLGHADGSLHSATVSPNAPDGIIVEERLPAHNPSVLDFSDRQPALHFVSQPSASTLLLGYALSRDGAFESSDYLYDGDVERLAVCSFELDSGCYCYLGDVLQDELRVMDDSKPYSARHRYTALSLPAVQAAVLYSNRAGETAILGPDPTAAADSRGGSSSSRHKRWVVYETEQDTDRAMVPSDSEWKDTYALGMAFDVTNRLSSADSVSEVGEHKSERHSEQQSELDAPMPMLFMLTSDGRLHMYHFICTQPSMSEASRRLMKPNVDDIPTAVSYLYETKEAMPAAVSGSYTASSQRGAEEASTAATTVSSAQSDIPPKPKSAGQWSFDVPTFTFSTNAAAPSFSFGSTASSTTSSTPSLFTTPATLSFGSPSSAFGKSTTSAASNWASLGSSSSAPSSSAASANPFAIGGGMASAGNPPAFSTAFSSPTNPFVSFSAPSFTAPSSSSLSSTSSSSFSSSATAPSSASLMSKPASSALPYVPPTTFAGLAGKQPGQWECDTCMLMNDATAARCKACESAKPGLAAAGASPAGSTAPSSISAAGFSFGGSMPAFDFSKSFSGGNASTSFDSTTVAAAAPPPAATSASQFDFAKSFASAGTASSFSFGGVSVAAPAAQPKAATAAVPSAPTTFASLAAAAKQSTQWECDVCMVKNDASATQCAACESKRPAGAASSAGAATTVPPPPFTPAAPAVSATSGFSSSFLSLTPSLTAAQKTPAAAARSPAVVAPEVPDVAGDEELVLPVIASSHRFKRFGTVQFSDSAYTETDMLPCLHRAASLLAVSNRYGRLFILSSSPDPTLLVASTAAVLESVEADKRQQAEEAEQDSKRVSDAAASPDVFVPVPLSDAEDVWHLSLSSDEQWLLVMDSDQASVFHISQFAQPEADLPVEPRHFFAASGCIDVQWSPQRPSVAYLLDYSGAVRAVLLTDEGCVQQAEYYNEEGPHATSICVSPFVHDQLWLGFEDSSLHTLSFDLAAGRATVTKRYAPHNPNSEAFPDQHPALHFVSQPSASTLLLGYALSRDGAFESSDYLYDGDVERLAVCSFELDSGCYCYLGDVLQDELRVMDDSKPYSARHRYTALSLPAVQAAVLYSNRAGETAILGPDPTAAADSRGGSSSSRHKRWVVYETEQDTDRAMVPSDSEWKDTYALGMAFDVTNRLSSADSVSEVGEHKSERHSEQQSELDAPMPMLFMLTSDGRLHMYHFICTQPSMSEASRRLMKPNVDDIPEEETYEELTHQERQLAVPGSSAPAAAGSSPAVARAAAVSDEQPSKRAFPPHASSTTPAFPFGSPSTTTPSFAFDPTKFASGNNAASAQPSASGRPAQPVVSNAPPSDFKFQPNVTASSTPAVGFGPTAAAPAAGMATPARSQPPSAVPPVQLAQPTAQSSKLPGASAPPTLAEALAMLAAALPNASPDEASVVMNALRTLIPAAPAAAATSPGAPTSHVRPRSPVHASARPAASNARPSRPAVSPADDAQHPSERSPPAVPASLSRPVQYVSSLNVDDFRLTPSSASETEKTFRHALTQLSKEMTMLRDITQESQDLLRNMYEPPNAQQHSQPTFSVHTAYRQQKQVNALRRGIDELSEATKEQEKALDDVLSYTQDNTRRVTALQMAEERSEDEEWRELIRKQPLSREAVQLSERIVGKLAELKKRRHELEEAVADEWKRVQGGHGGLGYSEDELTVAGVHRVVETHRALIEKQREEVRRLKDALRRGQARTTVEEREVRSLFSETPLKGLAGKRGWEKEEKKYQADEHQTRPAAPTYAKGATPAKAPIIESALQQLSSASPSFTTPPVSRQKPRSSASFTASPPSLTPATLSRINASFQQKLLQSSAASPPSQPAADRQQGADRIAQLMRRSEEARARAQAAFLSPLPSTLQLRNGGSADRGRSLQEAMAEGSGGRRWSRTKPQAEKDREEEERKEKEKRAREEEAKQAQQTLAQLMRTAQSGVSQSSVPSHSSYDGTKAKRAAPSGGEGAMPSKFGPGTSASSGFAPGFSFSGLGSESTGTTASPPPFNFQFKAPPTVAPVETVEKKEREPSKPALSPLSPPSIGKAAIPKAGAATKASTATKPSLPSDAQTATSPSAATGASSSGLVLPESPSLSKRKQLTASPPPGGAVPVPSKPAKPAATSSTTAVAPAAARPTTASAPALSAPSADSTSSSFTAASTASSAASTTSTTSSSSAAPAMSSFATAAAPSFAFSTSATSFAFSTSAAAPSFSFSTSAAAPSFSFSAPSTSTSASASSSVPSMLSSTASSVAADKTPARVDTTPATSSAALSSLASTAPSFGFGSSLAAPTTSSFASPFAAASSSATSSSFSFASPSKAGDAFGLSGLTSALSDSSSSFSSSGFTSSSASPFAAAFPAPSASSVANPFAAFASTTPSFSFSSATQPTLSSAAASPFATSSFDTAASSANSLRSLSNVFGSSEPAAATTAANPFQTNNNNPFQAPTNNGLTAPSNPFALPAQSSAVQQSPFGIAGPSAAPAAASPFAAPSSFGGIANPFDTSAAFGSGGFGQSFSSAAFGGGMSGSSAPSPFGQPSAPSAAGAGGSGFSAFAGGGGGGFGGGGFGAFGGGGSGQSGFASFAPPAGSGFSSFAQPAAAGGSAFGALAGSGVGGSAGGGFGGAGAGTGGFGSFSATAQQGGGSGGWGMANNGGLTLPQPKSFGFDTAGFRG